MKISEVPMVDVRGPLTAQRGRLLTGARYDTSQVQLWGDQTLAEPLLSVRGIIVLAVREGARRRRVPPGTWPTQNQPVPTQRNDTDTHADQGGTST